ncbi:MAG: hypothetical protein CMM56_03355 [Rhodospirillaceae bacterium]|nr:hypothetical protein [Rhodospirillaceae bacterium]|tara:strand:+ start:498 stop:1034 length:537 start_codon:yes stop_codon:yes gene_type:complete
MISIIKLSEQITKMLMVLAAGWAFFLTFIIITDVIGRTVFNTPIYGVPEIVMNSIVMIVFLQAGYAIRSGSMLRANFLAKNFPPSISRFVLTLGYLLGAIFFLMILFGSWDSAIHAWVAGEYEGEGALRVPAWPTRFTILFGSLIATISYLLMAYIEIFKPSQVDAEAELKAKSDNAA